MTQSNNVMDKAILVTSISSTELIEIIVNRIRTELNSISVSDQQEDEILTRKETAQFLKISLVTLHQWVNTGIIKPYKIGNRTYFSKQELLTQLFNSNLDNNKS